MLLLLPLRRLMMVSNVKQNVRYEPKATTSAPKKRKGKSKSTNGGQFAGPSVKQNVSFAGPSVKQNVRYEPKATTSAPKKRKGKSKSTNGGQFA
ncbi:hypothetical protein Tco_0068448, partial [Tanacetum coccineum]